MTVWIAFGIALLYAAAPDILRMLRGVAAMVPEGVKDGIALTTLVILPRALPSLAISAAIYYGMCVAVDVPPLHPFAPVNELAYMLVRLHGK